MQKLRAINNQLLVSSGKVAAPINLHPVLQNKKAQLLLLAGILMIIAFVAMSVTVVEIMNLGARTAYEEVEPAIVRDYRTIRSEFGKVLNESRIDSSGKTVSNMTFSEAVNATASSFRMLGESKGVDFYACLAGNGSVSPKTEWDFVNESSRKYAPLPTLSFDEDSDGIVYNKTSGKIVGAVIFFYISDERNQIYEVVFYRFE